MITKFCLILAIIESFYYSGQTQKIKEWNDANFDENLAKYGKAFVKFYAPWCGHCKRLAPTWEDVAQSLDEDKCAVVKVDCTDSGKKICDRFDVRGYPTLKFIKYSTDEDPSKNVIDFNGRRDIDALISFATKHTSPLYKELKDNEVADFINHETETTFILFTKSSETEAFKEFTQECEKYLGIAKFGVSFAKDPKKLLEFAGPESLVFKRSKQLTTSVEKSNGITDDVNEFPDFIRTNLHGRVAIRTPENDETINLPVATVFLSTSFNTNTSYFKMIRNRLFPLAKGFPHIQFAVASMSDFPGFIHSIGFDSSKDDIIFTIVDNEQKRYVPKASIKFDQLKTLPDLFKQFLDDYNDGKLEVYYKSQPIPDTQKPSEPTVVVAKNFDSIVMDDNKDVFIKMYAPWCGHCKKLAPIWEELAEKFKDEKNVVIAKFDATENDIVHMEYEITGFPTLFFAKAGQKNKPLQYDGARTLEALVAYIKEHSTKLSAQKDEL